MRIFEQFKNELSFIETKLRGLEQIKSSSPSPEFSYSAMDENFQRLLNQRLTSLEGRIKRNKMRDMESTAKEIQIVKEASDGLRKQNTFLWVAIVVLFIFSVSQFVL